jgi:hypothetical protein
MAVLADSLSSKGRLRISAMNMAGRSLDIARITRIARDACNQWKIRVST